MPLKFQLLLLFAGIAMMIYARYTDWRMKREKEAFDESIRVINKVMNK
jgi:hypothetical protein